MKGVQATSKAGQLLEAMRQSERAIWTKRECGESMGVDTFNVPNYLAAALKGSLIHRDQSGQLFSLQPFADSYAQGSKEPVGSAASAEVTGYVPPPMTAPRAGSDVRAPSRAVGEWVGPHIEPEPSPPEPEVPLEPADPEPEAAAFDFCVWRDGTLQVWGAEAVEDGSFRLDAHQLLAIRKHVAWLPRPVELAEEVQA